RPATAGDVVEQLSSLDAYWREPWAPRFDASRSTDAQRWTRHALSLAMPEPGGRHRASGN
ncbi:MAG: hypothetical protein KDD47_26530, partial [Acidobacteria bacterium]|nr:hypothetical protein [Acidobacteriota bacterium]